MGVEETYGAYRRSRRKRRAWAADNPGNAAIRAELRDAVLELAADPMDGDGEILDVGCGGGWLLGELAMHGVGEERLHGIDLLEPRVEVARRRLPGADVHQADARNLPWPDDGFHLLTLLTCLSSMPDRHSVDQALAEASRVLAPGGLLLVYEPRLPNPLNRATRRIAPRTLRRALSPELTEHGGRNLTGFPPLARRLGPLTPRLYPTLSRAASTHRVSTWKMPTRATSEL